MTVIDEQDDPWSGPAPFVVDGIVYYPIRALVSEAGDRPPMFELRMDTECFCSDEVADQWCPPYGAYHWTPDMPRVRFGAKPDGGESHG